MRVKLKLLLPVLPEVLGRKALTVEFDGETVNDLIGYLVAQHGSAARRALYDKKGGLDPTVQILLNGEEWVTHDRLDTVLQDGDDVVFMVMIAGG